MFGGHFQTIFHSDIISVSGCTCVQLLDTSFLQLDIYRLYLTIINKWQLKNGNKHNCILLLNHTLQLKLYFFLFQQNITSFDCLVTVVFKKNEVSVITKLITSNISKMNFLCALSISAFTCAMIYTFPIDLNQ
jgi:hypothetical protein